MRRFERLVVGSLLVWCVGHAAQSEAQEMTSDAIRALPMARTLGTPLPVPEMGGYPRLDGTSSMAPIHAAFGVVDLDRYDVALQSIYSISRRDYPADSIKNVERVRADDWVTRLTSSQAPDAATAGWRTVSLARVAVSAGRDSLARRIFDRRLAALTPHSAEYSYVSLQAIVAFADPRQDSTRLAHNIVWAEQYAARLMTLPTAGYSTRHDSASVLTRRWLAEDTLLVAYGTLRSIPQLLAHATRAIQLLAGLGGDERVTPMLQICTQVEAALLQTADGRTALPAFHRRAIQMLHAAIAARPSVSDKIRVTDETTLSMLERQTSDIDSLLAMVGREAPPIVAHRWMNTSDSLYHVSPVPRSFGDGRVHVVMFAEWGDVYSNDRLPILDRIQRDYPAGVELLFVTETTGAAGPDVVAPSDEVAWLAQYYRGVRHLVVPIAIWAGAKRSAGLGFVPEPSPNGPRYYSSRLERTCVIIDGHGIIRGYQPLVTRQDEAALRHTLDTLLAEHSS